MSSKEHDNWDIYVTIGNSDNKLTQKEWSEFVHDIDLLVTGTARSIYGIFFSSPTSEFQNACWSFVLDNSDLEYVKNRLRKLCDKHRQRAIAWANTQTELLHAEPPV